MTNLQVLHRLEQRLRAESRQEKRAEELYLMYADDSFTPAGRRLNQRLAEGAGKVAADRLTEADALVDVIDADEADWCWLHDVQSAQDNGKTWSEAVETADRDAIER